MKKLAIALMTLALLVCACAAADSADYTYYPQSEDCVGTWYTGEYIAEIEHMDGEQALFHCVVTRYDADDETGERWMYDNCAYDDISNAMSSVQIGIYATIVRDEDGEYVVDKIVYEDGAASFGLNEQGQLVWTDFNKAPGEDVMVFDKVPEGGDYPETDYEGLWVSDRAELTIVDLDDVIYVTIQWGNSAFETAEWGYEATYDETVGGLVTAPTGVKAIATYDEDGEVVSYEREYSDGEASFILNDEGNLVWTDLKADPAENETVFERVADAE